MKDEKRRTAAGNRLKRGGRAPGIMHYYLMAELISHLLGHRITLNVEADGSEGDRGLSIVTVSWGL